MRNIRGLLALLWSFGSIAMLFYILYKFGNQVEILTLIIGLVSGTVVSGLFGHYYGTTHKPHDQIDNEKIEDK